MRNILEILCKF